MKTVFKKWISLDVCPHCGSTDTYHSRPWDGYGNAYRVSLGVNHANPDERYFEKRDLCFQCGRDWVMYIEMFDMEGDEGKIT